MELPKILEQNINEILQLCRQYGVEKLYVFGSVLTERFDPDNSDLDFIVEMIELPPIKRGEYLISLWESLEDLFAKKVDLLSSQPIKNHYLQKNIDRTKRLIYDRKSEEVPG